MSGGAVPGVTGAACVLIGFILLFTSQTEEGRAYSLGFMLLGIALIVLAVAGDLAQVHRIIQAAQPESPH